MVNHLLLQSSYFQTKDYPLTTMFIIFEKDLIRILYKTGVFVSSLAITRNNMTVDNVFDFSCKIARRRREFLLKQCANLAKIE